jgi:hypothetical protein
MYSSRHFFMASVPLAPDSWPPSPIARPVGSLARIIEFLISSASAVSRFW